MVQSSDKVLLSPRQKDFARSKNKAYSSRSLISLDSVQSIISLDSVSSGESNHSEHSEITLTAGSPDQKNSTTEGDGDLHARHVELIQESWKALLSAPKGRAAVGEKIILKMMEIKPACKKALGISPSDRTARFNDLCARLVDMLHTIVGKMEPSNFCEEDLVMMGEEWLEEGLDARLVHKALIQCLEDTLDADDYSYEAGEAWASTFKDVLQKMAFMY